MNPWIERLGVLYRRGRQNVALRLAACYRGRLDGLWIVGVTGSCGKTSAKELIYAVLAAAMNGRKNKLTRNTHFAVACSVLKTRKSHDFLVQEVSVDVPGSMDPALRVLRPNVGVVTIVGLDHYRAFRTREAVAAEKGKLIACLPDDGLAILNADDELVLGMRALTKARCLTYGISQEADVRAEDVSAAWPERLSFTLVTNGERIPVRTQLCGKLWLPSALAALATGIGMGLDPKLAAAALEKVPPTPGRMYPVDVGDGVTFIRDDWKSPLWTIAPVLEFMRDAKAKRKIMVLGNISDYPGGADRRYPAVARQAAEVADRVMFVGPQAHLALKARKDVGEEKIEAFDHVKKLNERLKTLLGPGDLVLIKGSNKADHLERLTLDRQKPVVCWLSRCGRECFCSDCKRFCVPAEDPNFQ